METQCVGVTMPHKSNSGKIAGAGIGAAAGIAYNVHEAKGLVGYINGLTSDGASRLSKIQVKHPNITGTYKDVFQSYLKSDETGKKGIVFLKNNKEVVKRVGVMAGVIAAAAAGGILLGTVIDKIKTAVTNKQQNN